MNAIDIARRLSEMGAVADACQAYALVIHENSGKDPAVEMEAALYLLKFGGNYQMAYTCFQQLYNRGFYQAECLESSFPNILTYSAKTSFLLPISP